MARCTLFKISGILQLIPAGLSNSEGDPLCFLYILVVRSSLERSNNDLLRFDKIDFTSS